ncbi:carotenoid 1,2-hydratase [Neiella marina]|uniref:Carotenoid 1,2-hydratase n=1 Tax=Neiella holothuriorum TaxID=2870530 RepID=A0ABS7EDW6_9GAMM|nr:lipocalin-like domain-containing protein [Neiella holothuriorum]MBW8190513.1 carotenoid 1,2-hydratase [Neiella holothuriorum]
MTLFLKPVNATKAINNTLQPMLRATCLLLLTFASSVFANSDDYQALLAQDNGTYQQATGGNALSFPADHGPHPNFRMEWWYVTANLKDDQGQWYGAQWTLFRSGLNGQEALPKQRQIYMAHAALSWDGGHHAMQRYGRAVADQAGVTNKPFVAWLDHWQLASLQANSWLPMRMTAADNGYQMNLILSSERGLVLQGDNGFSVKNNQGSGSYYYSQPYLQLSGTITIDNQVIAVTGQGWLDREWSSQFLLPQQQGWDWLALHLDSGEKIMVYQLRSKPNTNQPHYKWLSWFDDQGLRKLHTQDFELTPAAFEQVAGRQVPQRWHVRHLQSGLDITVTSRQQQQWMAVDYPYWEGPVLISGSEQGEGYMEMTGYQPK